MRQVTAGTPPDEQYTPGTPGLSPAPEGHDAPCGPDAPARPGAEVVDCRDFYARMTSGVTVVTAQGPEGPAGSTVSATTSLSADPPLLLICLGGASRTLAVIEAQGRFGVNLLSESQRVRAELFADPRVGTAERFVATDHRRVHGVPVLSDTLGWAVCVVEDLRRYGDHCLVVGRIATTHTAAGRPLLWHDRSFHSLAGDDVAGDSLAPDDLAGHSPARPSLSGRGQEPAAPIGPRPPVETS